MSSHIRSPEAGTRTATPGRRLLVSAGLLSAWNGAVHLVLPLVYPWEEHSRDLYEPVRWALYAGTVFFGLLLLWAGLVAVVLARRPDLPAEVAGWVYGGLACFWLVGAGYEVLVPFPAQVANVALPAFSLVVAALFLAGLWCRRRAGCERK